MLYALLATRKESEVYELLKNATLSGQPANEDESVRLPELDLVRLIGSVRSHLQFVSRFGHDLRHVEDENGGHHFSYPEKLEEWLRLDAPGLSQTQVHDLFIADMDARNAAARRRNLEFVTSTDGIPDFHISTVSMLRAAFPSGLTIESADYNALCTFLHCEDYPFRAIAQILDFAFDLGYISVMNAIVFVGSEVWDAEVERIERLLTPHGLETWRREQD